MTAPNRQIHDHVMNGCNEALKIEVLDEPGAGGANHLYQVSGLDSSTNPSNPFIARYGEAAFYATILFQNGPLGETSVNGITQEVLIAICIDRLRSFQGGPYSCRENAIALTHLEDALHWLHHRTRSRLARGFEGTSEK